MSQSINNILDITRDMLYAAESGDWEHLSILEDSRSTMLSGLPLNMEAAQFSENVLIQAIESILELDRRIIALCAAESTSCKEKVRDFTKGRKAIASYHQFSD